jgi:hypothetical protein
MRLWYSALGTVPSIRSPTNRQIRQVLTVGLCLVLSSVPTKNSSSFAANQAPSIPAQQSKSTAPHVRSAIAVLATLEQAEVLPPEGTGDADRVIQYVIQFQSAFMKGTDPSLRDFAYRAIAVKHGEEATPVFERFRAGGWTAEMLEALADAEQRAPAEDRNRLTPGFKQFNVTVDDFTRFMQLIRDSRSALAARGQTFEEVYSRRRNAIPGASVPKQDGIKFMLHETFTTTH